MRNYEGPAEYLFVHHQGAGAPLPADFSFARKHYSGGWTEGAWAIVRLSVLTDISTKNFNGQCGIVIKGNRQEYPVGDAALKSLTKLVAALKHRGFIVPNPVILPHRAAPGLDTGTVCPGHYVYPDRWSDICLAIAAGLGWTPEGPPQEDDVAAASVIVYPLEPLPNGPFEGRRPTCHGISGTAALDHLTEQQQQTLEDAEIPVVGLPLVMWLDEDGVDRHLYRLRNGKLVAGTDKLPANY